MEQYAFVRDFLKNKKLPYGDWYFNPHLKQHVLLSDGGVYFYDLNYNLSFKEPKLRYMQSVQFVDEDLCVFVETSSTKVLFYSINTKEIVNRYSLRFSKKQNAYMVEVENAFFCRNANTIIFHVCYKDEESEKFNKHGIFAYNLDSKTYTKIIEDISPFAECVDYKNQFVFINSIRYEKYIYVINEQLDCKSVELKEEIKKLINHKHLSFDYETGLLVYYDTEEYRDPNKRGWERGCVTAKNIYDGYTYYGEGKNYLALDFDGNIQPWQPAHRYNEKPQKAISCNSDINFEDYVYEHGIDEFVAKNLSEEELESISEELLQGGYNWALEKIEKKAKDAGLGLYEFLGNEQITEDESILYSVGWLQAEIENGGMEQYFSNGDKKEFDLLIKALTTVGATETVEAIKKGARIIATFNKKQNPTEYECEKLSEKFENLECELTDDYAKLTIQYIKKSKLQS